MADLEKALATALRKPLMSASDSVDLDALEEAIEYGDIGAVDRELGLDDALILAIAAIIAKKLRDVFEEAAEAEGFPFDPLSEYERDWLQATSYAAAVALVGSARDTARSIIRRGLNAGWTSRKIALTVQYGMWANDRYVSAAMARSQRMAEQGTPEKTNERLLRQALLGYVAMRVAIFASDLAYSALKSARRFIWRIAVKLGLIDPEIARIRWRTARDERVCPKCGPLDGVKIKINEMFDTAVGPVDGPPLHPICRCELEMLING